MKMRNQRRAINRYARNPEKFDVIDLFDAIGRDKKLILGDEQDEAKFVDIVSNALSNRKSNTMIYGRRVEAMFAYMVASLGRCLLIKKEDSGDVFVDDITINIPDYRIVLEGGKQILVEVKNYRPKSNFSGYSLRTEYLCGLSKYADLMQTDFKVAVYWSKWNLWTLLSANDFENKGGNSTISFSCALKRNQMFALGDVSIGTTPPLSIRLHADKNQPHSISENNLADFTIGKTELLCNNRLITDANEQRIAFALIQFGEWEESTAVVTVSDVKKDIDYIEFSYTPVQDDKLQGFSIVGTSSTIISRQYGCFTAPNGDVERLSPDIEPGLLGFIIPQDYKGIALPLWRFRVEPNSD